MHEFDLQIIDGEKFAHEKLLDVAANCIHAVHKAPQISGKVKVKTLILTGKILEYMFEVQAIQGRYIAFQILSSSSWQRAYWAGESPVLLLIGAENLTRSELAWDCGACGFKTCGEMNKYHKTLDRGPMGETSFPGPVCMWKLFDFGIVCDWACASCWQANITNRIEAASGVAAKALGFLEDCDLVYGLPIGPMKDLFWYSREFINEFMPYDLWMEHAQTSYSVHWAVFPGHGRPTIKSGQEWWKTQKLRMLEDYDHQALIDTALQAREDVLEVRQRALKFLQDNDIDPKTFGVKEE